MFVIYYVYMIVGGNIMREATEKQLHVLNFIDEFINNHKYCPAVREIRDGIGLSTISGTQLHLKALERKGYIKRNGPRAIKILKRSR